MIKAILLLVRPEATWNGIVERKRGVVSTLLVYVLPLLVVTTSTVVWSMVHWGRPQGVREQTVAVPLNLALTYGATQFGLSLVCLFLGAQLVKAVGETFHGRHTYSQAFRAVAYAFGPLFLVRLFDMWPEMNGWITWSVGVLLALAALYHGLPRVMDPDPAHAFGYFFISSLLLAVVTGLARLISSEVLRHKLAFMPVTAIAGGG